MSDESAIIIERDGWTKNVAKWGKSISKNNCQYENFAFLSCEINYNQCQEKSQFQVKGLLNNCPSVTK